MILPQEKIKEILYFINAHRDGCSGDFVEKSLNILEQDVIDTLRHLYEKELITFANIENNLDDNEVMNLMILISGAYTDPEYKDIF